MENDITDQFACPICFEIPLAEIYQCKNGHTVCGECSKRIDTCPECRVQLGADKIRNRALEVILDSKKLQCPNKGVGCQVRMPRKEMSEHLKSCQFRESVIRLCHAMGYSCGYRTNTKNLVEALKHFQTCHNSPCHEGSSGRIVLEDFVNTSFNKNSVWSPIILKGVSEENTPPLTFMTVAKFNGTDHTLSMITLAMTSDVGNASSYSIEHIVRNNKDKARPMEWITPCIPLCDAESELNMPGFRIPAELLKTNYTRDGSVEIFLRIKSKEKGEKQVSFDTLEESAIHVINDSSGSAPSTDIGPAESPVSQIMPQGTAWVPKSRGSLDRFSVVAGLAFGRPFFVARTNHLGSLIPGHINSDNVCVHIPYNGQDLCKTKYEVLVDTPGTLSWIRYEGGQIPVNAIQGGYDPHGEIYYIGRVFHNQTISVGKIPKHYPDRCLIAYSGKVYGYEKYDILVSTPRPV